MVIGTAYEVTANHGQDEKIEMHELRFAEGYMDIVDLTVAPTEDMTWGTLRYALLGIGSFMQRWEYVTLKFDVVVPEFGRVGTGRVFQEERDGLDG